MSTKVPIEKNLHHLTVDGKEGSALDFVRVKGHLDAVFGKFKRDAYLHKRSIEEKKKANIATNEEKHLFSHFFDDDDSTRLPLKPQVNFYQWTGKVVVGGQEVIVLFDTGSTDFVVEKDAYCHGPTSKDTGKRAKVAWGDGSETAEVVVYRDHFRVGSLGEVDGVAVGHATTNFLANFQDQSNARAILGLGLPPLSDFGLTGSSFFDRLIEEGALEKNLFSFVFSKHGGEVTFGEISHHALSHNGHPDVHWHPIIPGSQGYWRVGMHIGSQKVNAIMDTGSSIVFGPVDEIKALFADFPTTTDFRIDEASGVLYVVLEDKEKTPDLELHYGSLKVKMRAETMKYSVDPKDGRAILGFMGVPEGALPKGTWLVGDNFMREFVTVFDRGHGGRVGLAPHKDTQVVVE